MDTEGKSCTEADTELRLNRKGCAQMTIRGRPAAAVNLEHSVRPQSPRALPYDFGEIAHSLFTIYFIQLDLVICFRYMQSDIHLSTATVFLAFISAALPRFQHISCLPYCPGRLRARPCSALHQFYYGTRQIYR